MFEKITAKGFFWVPAHPESVYAGILTYDPEEGVELEIIGSASQSSTHAFSDAKIVHGETNERGACTLLDVWELPKRHFPNATTTNLKTRCALLGARIDSEEQLLVNIAVIGLSDLADWVYPLQTKSQMREGPPLVIQTERTIPETVECNISDGLRLSLVSYPTNPAYPSRDSPGRLDTEFWARFAAPVSLEAVNGLVWTLMQFITFAVRRPSVALRLQVDIFVPGQSPDTPRVEVLHRRSRNEIPQWGVDRHTVRFSYESIQQEFEGVLRKWLDIDRTLQSVLNLYFSTLYFDDMMIAHEFLSLVQALEIYHRTIYGGTGIPLEDHSILKERLSEWTQGFAPQSREWVQRKVEHNEPSQRQRLRGLCNLFGQYLRDDLSKDSDFIKSVVDVRNRYIHYGELSPSEHLNTKEVLKLTRTLRKMLELALLERLGLLDNDSIRTTVNGYRYLPGEFPSLP